MDTQSKTEQDVMAAWGDQRSPLLSIICLTYNHAAFIKETLEGFIRQETDFPLNGTATGLPNWPKMPSLS